MRKEKKIETKPFFEIYSCQTSNTKQKDNSEEEPKGNILVAGEIKSRIYKNLFGKSGEENKGEGYILYKNDIILKRISPIYVTLIDKENMILGSNLICIRIKKEWIKKIYPGFVACYIETKIPDFTREAKLPTVVISQLENELIKLGIKLENIFYEEQKSIGEAWQLNNIQYEYDKYLADESFGYNRDLIIRKMNKELGE